MNDQPVTLKERIIEAVDTLSETTALSRVDEMLAAAREALMAVKGLISEVLDDEKDERVEGNEYARERGSAYENVDNWIDHMLADLHADAERKTK